MSAAARDDALVQVGLVRLREMVRHGGHLLSEFPEHDRGAVLAATHVRAELDGLAVRQPPVEGVALELRLQPEQHRVDAAVGATAGGIDGRAVDVLRPGANPRRHTGFKGGDDLGGDAGVKIVRAHGCTSSRGSR
jgi:hypothetical protein